MTAQKTFTKILIFALLFLVCVFTSACNSDDSGISIKHESKLRNLQQQEKRNSKIVYLGTYDEKNYNIGGFGPRDITFDDMSMR